MFRDRLVCGINAQKLQRRLLAEQTLTYEKAFALVQALETADKSDKELEKASGVHFMHHHSRTQGTPAGPQRQGQACYHCVGTNHPSATCRFKDSDYTSTVGKRGISLKSAGVAPTIAHALSEDAASLCSRNPSRLTSSTKSRPKTQYTRFSIYLPHALSQWSLLYNSTRPHSTWKSTLEPQPRSSASKPISHSGRQRKPLPYSPVRSNSVPTQGKSSKY